VELGYCDAHASFMLGAGPVAATGTVLAEPTHAQLSNAKFGPTLDPFSSIAGGVAP
jgi:hypothetical protein